MASRATTAMTTAALLVLLSIACDVFAFAPGPQQQLQSRRPSVVRRSATINDDENALSIDDGWGKASGGAAAFLMGMGIMAQLAFADTTAITVIDAGEF
jgi:hypothetical protein